MGAPGIDAGRGRGAASRPDVAAGRGGDEDARGDAGGATGGGEQGRRAEGGRQAGAGAEDVGGGRRKGRRGRGRGHDKARGEGHRKRGCGGDDGARAGAESIGARPTTTAPARPDGAGAAQAGPSTADALAPPTTPAPTAAGADAAPTATGPAAGDPAELIAPGADAGTAAIAQVARDFAGSPVATQVLQMIARGGAAIDIVDDASFQQQYGRASGVYDPRTKRIALPESVLRDPAQLRIVLLHEGVHWVQDNTPGGIGAIGGPVAQALQGAAALPNVDRNSTAGVQHDEAQAFLLEAIAAKEAGVGDPGLATSNGQVLPYGQVVAAVKQVPEYR